MVLKDKKLSQTNPYLQNAGKRRAAVKASVCSSSAIEGIAAQEIVNDYLLNKSHPYPSTLRNLAKSGQSHP